MRRVKNIIFLIFIFFAVAFLYKPPAALADNSCTEVKIFTADNNGNITNAPDHFIDGTFNSISYTITVNDPNAQYEIIGDDDTVIYINQYPVRRNYHEIKNGPTLQGTINKSSNELEFNQSYNNHRLTVKKLFIDPTTKQQSWQVVCDPNGDNRLHYFIDPAPTPTPYYNCNLFGRTKNANQYMVTETDEFWILGNISPNPADTMSVNMTLLNLDDNSSTNLYPKIVSGIDHQFEVDVGKKRAGKYRVSATPVVQVCDGSSGTMLCTDQELGPVCNMIFSVCAISNPGCGFPTPTPIPTATPPPPAICNDKDARDQKLCTGGYETCPWCNIKKSNIPGINIPNLKPLCDQLSPENNYRDECWKCQKSGGIWSALGCLPTDFSALIKEKVFPIGLGIAGGVAFLYFLYGAFMILTSSGNAEAIEEAKQIITSALAGLLLIIFSIFILQVIGVQILQLPGFK